MNSCIVFCNASNELATSYKDLNKSHDESNISSTKMCEIFLNLSSSITKEVNVNIGLLSQIII